MNGPEQLNSHEKSEISENTLIEALRQNAESPEAKQLLQAYCAQEEAKVESIGTEEAQIIWNVRLGLIYAKAGYTDMALAALEEALNQAHGSYKDELYYDIEYEIKKLRPE